MIDRNPFILTSEHRRILESAQKRYDEKLNEQHRLGFWRGIAITFWITLVAAAIGSVAGYYVGSEPKTELCVPLYDQTGLERCQ